MDPQVLARLDELEDALRQHEAQVTADSDGDGGDGAVPDDRVGGGTDHHRTDGGYPRPVPTKPTMTHVIFRHVYPPFEVEVEVDKAWEFYEQAQRDHESYEVAQARFELGAKRWKAWTKHWMVWDADLGVWRITRFQDGPSNPHLEGRLVRLRLLGGTWVPCLVDLGENKWKNSARRSLRVG